MSEPRRKNILHVSDLHFGKLQDNVVNKLLEFIHHSDHGTIDVVIISGDLTQRARSKQFIAAAEFLKQVKRPVMAVPGNHDVPLYNLLKRFIKPFRGFDKYISPVAAHFYEDREIFIQGIKTNNIFRVARGRVSPTEVTLVEKGFSSPEAKNKLRILVGHHPIFENILISSPKTKALLRKILNLKPHLFLFGHDHQSKAHWLDEKEMMPPILVGAGTGTSRRLRQEANSVNLITWDPLNCVVSVKVFVFEADTQFFVMASEKRFQLQSLNI